MFFFYNCEISIWNITFQSNFSTTLKIIWMITNHFGIAVMLWGELKQYPNCHLCVFQYSQSNLWTPCRDDPTFNGPPMNVKSKSPQFTFLTRLAFFGPRENSKRRLWFSLGLIKGFFSFEFIQSHALLMNFNSFGVRKHKQCQ